MSLLQSKAEQIYFKLPRNPNKQFNIITILSIISLLVQLFRLFKSQGKSSREILKCFKNPGLLERLLIKKKMNDSFTHNHDVEGLEKTLYKVGRTFSIGDIKQLYRDSLNEELKK